MRFLTSKEFADAWWEHQQKRRDDPDAEKKWLWPMDELNRVTGGARMGEYFVFVSGAKMGKTSTLVSIGNCFSEQKCRVGMFGLEMNALQIGDRVFANLAGVELNVIRDLDVSDEEWKRLEKHKKHVAEEWLTTWIEGSKGTMREVRKAVQVNDIDVLIIDYVQLMTVAGRMGRTERLEELSREMKLLTLDAEIGGVTIITAAQGHLRNIGGVQKLGRGSVFGSGAFERDADMVIVMNYVYDEMDEELPHVREFQIVATRISAEHTFECAFIGSQAKIGNLVKDPQQVDLFDEAVQM